MFYQKDDHWWKHIDGRVKIMGLVPHRSSMVGYGIAPQDEPIHLPGPHPSIKRFCQFSEF